MVTRKRLAASRWALVGCSFFGAVGVLAYTGHSQPVKLWTMAGQNLHNTRFQEKDSQLERRDLDRLGVEWVYETAANISATATVDKDFVYVPDFDQFVHKIDRRTGQAEWVVSIGDYTGLPGNFSRSSPTLSEDLVIVGDQGGLGGIGAKVLALDRETGALVWMTQVDSHLAAYITASPVIHDGVVYQGVSSVETFFATFPRYPCCTFRGSMVALDLETGQILWKTYFTPDPPPGWDFQVDGRWYSGTAVWGSTPVVDVTRNALYVTTGQNYTVPQSVLDCVDAANQGGGDPRLCNDPSNRFDSIIALDLETGAVRWGEPAIPYDAWTVACLFGPPKNCPSPAGPDFDFGQGAALFTTESGRQLVGAGQKSGVYWAHDPDTGAVVWSTQVGPGGLAGGLQWGSAVDGRRVYVAEANSDGEVWNLVNPAPDSAATTTGGGWSALDAETGEILWQAADPLGGIAWSPVAVNKDGLVFACSMDDAGHMYALDGLTGRRLWSFASGGSCVAGAALVDKNVYWGSGYIGPGGVGVPNNQLYAFGR